MYWNNQIIDKVKQIIKRVAGGRKKDKKTTKNGNINVDVVTLYVKEVQFTELICISQKNPTKHK